jgi:TPP-dependent pyruvate/acetoin dehydrogenase alpha subunit
MAKGELEAAMIRDPFVALRQLIVARGAASDADLTAMEDALRTEIDEAAAYAFAAKYPEPEEALEDVYASAVS